MFWIQKESEASPFPADCRLSLTESFLNSISKNAKENFYRDEKAFAAGWPDSGAGDYSLGRYPNTALRPTLHNHSDALTD
jgi:hypothetical protein